MKEVARENFTAEDRSMVKPKRRIQFLQKIAAPIVILAWLFSGFPKIWDNPRIPPKIQVAQAAAIAQYSGGLLVYADTATVGTPKYKTFDDTNGFGAEQSATSVGSAAIEWIRVAASPTKDEWIIATRDANDDIAVQVCTGVDGGVSCGSITTVTATAGTHGFRNYDVAYERSSGDALLVYGTATVDELRKIVWTAGAWGSDAAITTTITAGAVEWVELTSRPASDQIGIAYSDTADDISAYRWSGTAVADEATQAITTSGVAGDIRKFDISFEGASGDMVVGAPVAAAGTIAYGQLSGTTWSFVSGTGVDVVTAFLDMQEPGSDDDIAVEAVGSAATSNLSEGSEWNGTGVTDGNNGDDVAANWAANYQLGAVAYFSTTYYGVAVLSSTVSGADDIEWWTMSSAGTITDQTVNTRTRGAARFIDLFDYPNADKVLLLTADANSDLWADTWAGAAVDGTAWTDLTSGGALELSLASATTDVVDFAFRLAPNAPTVTTSSATSVTATTATLNGNITATGGANATVRGFAWGTNSELSGGDTATTTENGSFGTGVFTDTSLTLVCNTTYYSRAYATNPGGTGLGAISASFTTSACASLTFVVSTDVFPTLTPGSSVFATSTLSVDTNNSTGWNVTVARDDADTTMDLDTDATANIIDQTAWSPGVATTTAGNAVRIASLDSSGDVLAMRVMTASGTPSFISTAWWGTTDAYIDSATVLWAGFNSTAKKIGDSSVSSGGSAKLNTVLYYLDVSSTQKTGAYSGGITYTATMNP